MTSGQGFHHRQFWCYHIWPDSSKLRWTPCTLGSAQFFLNGKLWETPPMHLLLPPATCSVTGWRGPRCRLWSGQTIKICLTFRQLSVSTLARHSGCYFLVYLPLHLPIVLDPAVLSLTLCPASMSPQTLPAVLRPSCSAWSEPLTGRSNPRSRRLYTLNWTQVTVLTAPLFLKPSQVLHWVHTAHFTWHTSLAQNRCCLF